MLTLLDDGRGLLDLFGRQVQPSLDLRPSEGHRTRSLVMDLVQSHSLASLKDLPNACFQLVRGLSMEGRPISPQFGLTLGGGIGTERFQLALIRFGDATSGLSMVLKERLQTRSLSLGQLQFLLDSWFPEDRDFTLRLVIEALLVMSLAFLSNRPLPLVPPVDFLHFFLLNM